MNYYFHKAYGILQSLFNWCRFICMKNTKKEADRSLKSVRKAFTKYLTFKI